MSDTTENHKQVLCQLRNELDRLTNKHDQLTAEIQKVRDAIMAVYDLPEPEQ